MHTDAPRSNRAVIIADPSPPPIPNFNQPSLPPIISPIIGTGDAGSLKDAEKLAAYHACLQLGARRLFTASNLPTRQGTKSGVFATSTGTSSASGKINDNKTVALTNGTRIGLEEARAFMDYYCSKFKFDKPDLRYTQAAGPSGGGGGRMGRGGRGGGKTGSESWTATLLVGGKRIGMGEAQSKKVAMDKAYLDTAQYLEECDQDLWRMWCDKKNSALVLKGGMPAHVVFEVDAKTDEELRDTVHESRESALYKRAKAMIENEKVKAEAERERVRNLKNRSDGSAINGTDASADGRNGSRGGRYRSSPAERALMLEKKSEELSTRLRNYQTDPRVERMRNQRASLPVASHASSVMARIATSSVVVVLAATGSGKTTQVPQLILDDWILRGDGAKCNIVCTQPRRIAAISVAERVASERGEKIGDSVGYQVPSLGLNLSARNYLS
jgi:hypothetical protein